MDTPDRNAAARERRRARRRRQVRIRRTVAVAVLLALVAGIALGARAVGGGSGKHAAAPPAKGSHSTARANGGPPIPDQIRGVHVTMALASLPGKLQQYFVIPGLNAIELDVKDENGRVGFERPRL